MTEWTTHHFTGGQDEQGRFKGKGELQLKQVEKTIMMKVKVVFMLVKVMRMMIDNDDESVSDDEHEVTAMWR